VPNIMKIGTLQQNKKGEWFFGTQCIFTRNWLRKYTHTKCCACILVVRYDSDTYIDNSSGRDRGYFVVERTKLCALCAEL